MRILSCNIRCYGGEDGENNWEHRKGISIDVIRDQAPHIICFQELWIQQWRDIAPAFPEFAFFGMVDTVLGRHPMNGILYRKDTFSRVSAGGYWLSETPHITGSSSWDSACIRLANWIRLEERASGKEFRIINTHLDHVSQKARENQARLVNDDTAAYPDEYPQILTGDMNCDIRNPAIQAFKRAGWLDTYAAVHGAADPGHTYHAFMGPAFKSRIGKMDWIFARGSLDIRDATILRDARAGSQTGDKRFPSDHYFIAADVAL